MGDAKPIRLSKAQGNLLRRMLHRKESVAGELAVPVGNRTSRALFRHGLITLETKGWAKLVGKELARLTDSGDAMARKIDAEWLDANAGAAK